VKQQRAKDNGDESEGREAVRQIRALCRIGVYREVKRPTVQSWAAHTMISSVICSVCVCVFACVAVHAHSITRAAGMVRSDGGFVIGFGVGLGPCFTGGIGVRCLGFADRTIRMRWSPGSYLGCPGAVLVVRGCRCGGWCVICPVGGPNQGSTVSVNGTHGLHRGR
jgi:hypothetical protein